MKLSKFLGILISLICVLCLLAGCAPEPVKSVRLDRVDPTVGNQEKLTTGQNQLRLAVSSVLSLQETLSTYQPLIEYLESKFGYPVVLLQRRTYQEVNDLLQQRKADVAFVCSGGYIAGVRGFGMELLAIPQVNGQRTYRSYIITPAASLAQSIADLSGRSFAYTDPLSFSGHIAPVYMLLQSKFDSDRFFSRTFYTYSHDNAIRAVADGIVDGAAVDSMIYDRATEINPSVAKRTKIVDRSLFVGNPPVVIAPGTDPLLKKQLLDILFAMHETASGKKVLASLTYDRFTPPDESLYRELQNVWNLVREKL